MNRSTTPAAHDTVAQLKNDIDSGRTGDKVAAIDPGLSPLGTDDEAAGRPLSPEQISLARRQEAAIGTVAAKEDGGSEGLSSIVIMGALVAVIIAVVVAFFLMNN